MKKILLFVLLLVLSIPALPVNSAPTVAIMRLPDQDLNGRFSLEQVIKNRRNISDFTAQELKIEQIGQLCWSGQGITDSAGGLRTTPSAMDIYPMQLNVVLPDGLYVYDPNGHNLIKQIDGDIRPMLFGAVFRLPVVKNSPCIFIISGSARKVEVELRGRGERFICLEAGRIAQNLQLQAVSLGLGSMPIGSFDSRTVARVCRLTEDLEPVYMICVGSPAQKTFLEPVLSQGYAPIVRQTAPVRPRRAVIIVPSQYFEDKEFFGTQEALQIAGIGVDIASSIKGDIKGIEKNVIKSAMLVGDIKIDDYDAFIFIGGQGVKEYFANNAILKLVRTANENKKILAAIGTAPGIFASAGIVRDKNIASFPSQRLNLINAGAKWQRKGLQIDGNLITADSPGTSGGQNESRRFGAAIVQMMKQQGG
ncbi:MAG: DJ-1/PfpI family protein [Phycisphaerae bacterium]|jgi:SagB-type dehydrogenase family enzyme